MSDVLFRIVIEDAGVNVALKDNRALVKQLNDELKKTSAGTKEYKELAEQLVRAKVETTNLKDQQRALNNEFKATRVPTDSLAGLRLEYGKLTAQINNLSRAERESNFGKNLIKNAASVKKEIDGIEQSVGRFTGNVGNYQSALNSFTSLIKGSLGPLAALAAAQKIISNNSEVSDRVADVAKAADISTESVNRLADALEKRLTRTSLIDQLGIAEIGGKLGVAEKDLFSFVEAVDVVNVALGDQFGGSVEQTTDVIGKLRNVLTDIKTDNVGKDIQNIGNSLNFLEAQGAASAGVIADFAGRIAGAGRNLGVTSGQIIGVSATLDELGVNAERGSSAYVRILQRVAAAPAAFAKAAGESSDSFTKLVNEDIAGAVNLFLSKINDQNLSNTELQAVLKDLKLEGVGTAEVVGKLGQNLELLEIRTTEAGGALKSTDSIQQEFEKKNQTLGAAVQNLSNAFFNLTTDSKIADFLKGLIQGVTDLIGLFQSENNVLKEQQVEFNALIGVLQNTNTTEAERARVLTQLKKEYPDYIQFVKDDATGQIDLAKTLLEGNKLFEARALLQATESERVEITKRKISAENELTKALVEQQKIQQSGTGGQRVGIIRNEAGDQLTNAPDRARIAQERVDGLREVIKKADEQTQALINTANSTALRTAGKTLDELSNSLTGNKKGPTTQTDAETPTGSNNLDKTEKEAKAAAGSIADLREKISKLNTALENAPNDTKVLDPLILKLKQAEFALTELETKVKRFDKAEAPISEDQNILNELAGGAKPKPESTEAGRDALKGIVEQQSAELELEEEKRLKLEELDNLFNERKMKRDEKSVEDEIKRREKLRDAVIQAAEEAASALFQIQENKIAQEEQKQLDAIDTEYKTRIEAAQGNAVLIDQLEKEQAAKKEAVEKESAEKRKKTAKTEALIAGALAVVKALPNFILAALAAVTTAAQIAIIDSAQFAEGGFTGKGGKKDSTGRRVAGSYMKGNTQIIYHENEYIAPTSQIQRYPELFDFLEQDRKGKSRKFAEGGFTDFVPQVFGQPSSQNTVIVAGFSREQEESIARVIAREVAAATGASVEKGAAVGLDNANRMIERQNAAEERRQI